MNNEKVSEEVCVSVVMAVYNGERWLGLQLESIIKQLCGKDELIIIDDSSSDGSYNLCRSLAVECVQVVRNECNLGVIPSFERGLRLARNPVIVLSDQDDIWLDERLIRIRSAFYKNEKLSCVIHDATVINENGVVTSKSFMKGKGGFKSKFLSTLVKNRYLGCAMAVSNNVRDGSVPFPENIPMHDMWLGFVASQIGEVEYIDEPLIKHRRHGENASPTTGGTVVERVRWRVSFIYAALRYVFKVLK